MKFDEALKLMKQGFKVRLPEWQDRYWCWENDTIMVHYRHNTSIDLFDLDNKELTLDNMVSDKFEIIQEILGLSTADAYKALTSTKTNETHIERFKAEYQQLKHRLDKLDIMLTKHEAEVLGFTPTCPISMLEDQRYYMDNYLRLLKTRAEIEEIDLG